MTVRWGGMDIPEISRERHRTMTYRHIPSDISITEGESDAMARDFHAHEWTVRKGEDVLGVVHFYILFDEMREIRARAWEDKYGTRYNSHPLKDQREFIRSHTLKNGHISAITRMDSFSDLHKFLNSQQFQSVLMLLFLVGDSSPGDEHILPSRIEFRPRELPETMHDVFHSPIAEMAR